MDPYSSDHNHSRSTGVSLHRLPYGNMLRYAHGEMALLPFPLIKRGAANPAWGQFAPVMVLRMDKV